MKKSNKIYVFAIALLTVILTVFFAGCSTPQIEVNSIDSTNQNYGERAYEYLQTLAGEELRNRTLGTQGELDGAKYIASIMTDLGYEGLYTSEDGNGLQEFKTTFKRFDGQEINDTLAHNVIFTKKSSADKSKGEIILACSYDNLYSEKLDVSGTLWNADGSYESGSSVAVLLTLAELLKDKTSDYDLTFAFFTGGCYGWKGAMNFVDNLDRTRLDRVSLMLNFAMLGGGDNWYIYTGEGKPDYGVYLNECSGGNVTAVPKDRNIGQFILSEDAIYNYANIGMLSNQYYLDVKDVPTANVLSLNWEINDNPLFSEMKGKDNVYHTSKDTLQNMIERKDESALKEQLFEIINTTLTALDETNQDTLMECLSVAREQLPNANMQSGKSANLANIIIKVVLIAILIAGSFVLKNHLSKNIKKYMAVKKATEETDGSADEEQEPFSFEDTKIDGTDAQQSQNSQKNAKNNEEDDPFV